jgi:transcriptional regulator with XRE-family HTH domain
VDSIGTRIRNLRTARGWTQKQTADALGLCTKAAIGKFERNECGLSDETINGLSNLFGVTPDFLRMGNDSQRLPAPGVRRFRIHGKPKERTGVQLYPTTVAKVKRLARENGISVAEAVDQIVDYAISSLED